MPVTAQIGSFQMPLRDYPDPPPVIVFGAAVLLVLVAGPLLLGVKGFIISRRASIEAEPARSWDWKLAVGSALCYSLAFNLTFFIQEFFLVLPKSLTPGLRPILYHNNHTWTGANPMAGLFQGTGALANFVLGGVFVLWFRLRPPGSIVARLFLIWMAYNGFLQSLPQVVVGSLEPANDVGMAMDYFHWSAAAKMVAALLALFGIAVVALSLRGPLLDLAQSRDDIANGRARTRFVFRVAAVPALAAILLIIPFRIPRNWIEVVGVPVLVTFLGIAWIQAGAWAASSAKAGGGTLGLRSISYSFGALLLLLLIFQVFLRQGVRFY
jgi:hypothetical protein